MAEKVTDLTPRQRRAIEALIEGKTVKQAAEETGVSRKTLYVWLNQPEFQKELDRLGGIILEEVANRMVALASEAVHTLSNVLKTKDVPIGTQVQAANVILKRASEFWDVYNLNRRIDAIEAVLNDANDQS
ncbi:MAG: helix-turn-helix domain-containing protein [Chloroflexi bacterium]|nr:helix-turn-helix domain-containing protein [Chloroflexota bacterium]